MPFKTAAAIKISPSLNTTIFVCVKKSQSYVNYVKAEFRIKNRVKDPLEIFLKFVGDSV